MSNNKKSNVERVTYNTLENLLGGIYEAIVSAQKTVTIASMDMWRKQHFNADDTPKTIKFNLPTGVADVPTAVLVNSSNIGIKDVEFEMEMKLDINEEIEKDLQDHRRLTWEDIKVLAVKRGWLKTGNEMGLGKLREGIVIADKFIMLYEIDTNGVSIWKPNSSWAGKNKVSNDFEKDLKINKAFRYWLDLNDFDPEDWGFPKKAKKQIGADSSSRGSGNMAKIKVTFEGKENPEGIARLGDIYIKTIPST